MIAGTDTVTPLFAELAFRGWFPLWLAVVLGLLAAISVVFLYLREAGRVSAPARVLMATLRALTLLFVLFLALRPSLIYESHGDRPKSVALLLDDSQSMATQDLRLNFPDRWRSAVAFDLVAPNKPMPMQPSAGDVPDNLPEKPARIEIAKKVLKNPRLNLLPRLEGIGPLHPATFGVRRIARDPRDAGWFDGLKGTETKTALVDSTYELLRRDESELPAAIVVITDGRENASERSLEDLAREALRVSVPLYIYGVGSTSFGQLRIRDVAVSETLFVDDTVAVPIRYQVRGFKEGVLEMVMKLGGQEVARKTVAIKEGDNLREVLSFVPEQKDAQPGKQELTTTFKVLAGPESIVDEVTKNVRVIDRKIKVLCVDSIPRWDFKFLQRALLRDRRVLAEFYLTDVDSRAMKSGPPFVPNFPQTRPELFSYDLLILGDIPASLLTADQQTMAREFVAEGGGLIQIAGRNYGPATYVGTPLMDVLPVELQPVQFSNDAGARPAPYRPDLSPLGLRSPLLSLDDDPIENMRIWKTLPELYWHYPVTKLKPAAETYLTHPKATLADGKPMPLLASHYYGKGYCIFVGFDETWRWRFNEGDTYFSRFWSQAVYVAGVPRTLGTKMTQLSIDTLDPQLGKTGQVYARLFNAELRPLISDRIEARLERLDAAPDDKDRGTSLELRALPGQPGEYVATIPFNRVGKFALRVDNGNDPASIEYRVSLPPDHELAPGGLAEDDMRKLAESTGGRFYHEEDLHHLPDDIKPKTTPFTRRDEILLWNKWSLFALIGLLSLEWIVRKLNSLS